MEEIPIIDIEDSKVTTTATTSPIIKSLELESELESSSSSSNNNNNKTTNTTTTTTTQTELITERKMKRPRDAGPTTPRGEGDEFKVLGRLTPLAKKGRVQPDSNGNHLDTPEDGSDTSSIGGGAGGREEEDSEIIEEEEVLGESTISTPPPHVPAPGLETDSAPPTPILASNTLGPIKREGLETMKIRHRVQALEWEDDGNITPSLDMEDEDTVIVDEVIDQSEDNGLAAGQEVKDVELKDAVHEENVEEEVSEPKDVEITDLMKEGVESDSTKEVEKEDKEMSISSELVTEEKQKIEEEKDVEFAEVAAEVGSTAEVVHAEDDKKEAEIMETSEVAAEVAVSAKLVAIEDEKDEKIADVAAEVAESAAVVQEEPKAEETTSISARTEKELPALPVIPASPIKNSFTSFSSNSSPFSAFKSTTSPFGSVSPPPPPAQKPKSKSTFGAPSLKPESLSTPIATSTSTSLSDLPSISLPSSFGTTSALPTTSSESKTSPTSSSTSTPFSKFSSSSALASSSSNNTSVASVLVVAPTTTITASPFSAFSSLSGFASASTISSSSSGFGSYSAASASPFASIQSQISGSAKDDNEGSSSRKLGEPEEVDAGKRVFTEQELFTGEEDDNTIHTVRSKLFAMNEGSWVERGTGILRLNLTKDSSKNGARLVMRADATHRLLLNATLFPGFSIELSQEKFVRFTVIEESGPMSYMLRMAGTPAAQSLVDVVKGRVAQL